MTDRTRLKAIEKIAQYYGHREGDIEDTFRRYGGQSARPLRMPYRPQGSATSAPSAPVQPARPSGPQYQARPQAPVAPAPTAQPSQPVPRMSREAYDALKIRNGRNMARGVDSNGMPVRRVSDPGVGAYWDSLNLKSSLGHTAANMGLSFANGIAETPATLMALPALLTGTGNYAKAQDWLNEKMRLKGVQDYLRSNADRHARAYLDDLDLADSDDSWTARLARGSQASATTFGNLAGSGAAFGGALGAVGKAVKAVGAGKAVGAVANAAPRVANIASKAWRLTRKPVGLAGAGWIVLDGLSRFADSYGRYANADLEHPDAYASMPPGGADRPDWLRYYSGS